MPGLSKKIRLLLFLLVLLILITPLFFIFYITSNSTTSIELPSDETFDSFWVDKIKKKGDNEAYELFVDTYTDSNHASLHALAHKFGQLLYNNSGIDAVHVCDGRFSYGCYHEVLANVIKNEGLGAVSELDKICIDDLGCQHGIGHGIAGYYGYGDDTLVEAIKVCDKVSDDKVIEGCLGGVFMEHNMHTMTLGTDYESKRVLNEENPDEICELVPENTANACYYWLAQWYLEIVPGDVNYRFKVTGKYCSDSPGSNKKYCFEGIGYNVNGYSDSEEDTVFLCNLAAGENKNYTNACLERAAIDYISSGREESAEFLCRTNGLSNEICNDLLN